jgi:hypothetical protein
MKKSPPLRNRTNLSLFIGLWLGLTALAGVCAFVGIFIYLGGLRAAAALPTLTPLPLPSATTAVVPPTRLAPATDEPLTPAETATPACALRPERPSGFAYGIQSHVFVGENDFWLGVITDKLNFDWVKMQVRWNDLEKDPGAIYWDVLDGAMRVACAKGLRVMLSVVAAPSWTQANPMPANEGQESPPDDPGLYAQFLGAILDRYPGQVGAIEVWNEMNLEREWNTPDGVSAAAYVELLQAAHSMIKSKDSDVIVISGGLSPTGINCNGVFPDCQATGRPIVVDDVTYLGQFIQAGGLAYADCIGTHSNGTNLPPIADGANPPPRGDYQFGGPWDNPHYSWALKSQVETYAALLNGQLKQCVTEFGYASPVDGKYSPNFGFAVDVTEQQQGEYLVQAFNWMRDSGLVSMAFLFNMDYGPKGGDPAVDDNVIFSVLRPDGAPRPAFDLLSLMPKP